MKMCLFSEGTPTILLCLILAVDAGMQGFFGSSNPLGLLKKAVRDHRLFFVKKNLRPSVVAVFTVITDYEDIGNVIHHSGLPIQLSWS